MVQSAVSSRKSLFTMFIVNCDNPTGANLPSPEQHKNEKYNAQRYDECRSNRPVYANTYIALAHQMKTRSPAVADKPLVHAEESPSGE